MISYYELINSFTQGNARPFNNHAFLVITNALSSITLQKQLSHISEHTLSVTVIEGDSGLEEIRSLHESLIRGDGGIRIVIIDQAHRLRVPSANALLKIIEEPPQNISFILTTPGSHHVLPTLRSRCMPVRFIEESSFYEQRIANLSSIEQLRALGLAERLLSQIDYDDDILTAHATMFRSAIPMYQMTDSPTSLMSWYDALIALARTPHNQRTATLKTALLCSIPLMSLPPK